jgi:2,3-bisphosphoglycerate-independent phosphoglycerate mutase
MDYTLIESLVIPGSTRIVFLILDGLSGLPDPVQGTELQAARTPNLDALAKRSACGLIDPIMPGVTPGSGPAHFALFGYDPLENNIGRGLLEGVGIGMELSSRDVVARINFATLGPDGSITDRRAGRISTEECRRLCDVLQQAVDLAPEAEFRIMPVKEHRAMILISADGLSGELRDTDPQKVGLAPLEPAAHPGAEGPEADRTAALVSRFIDQARAALAGEEKANGVLTRGFAKWRSYRSFSERFGLDAYAIAGYPMYRGLASLLGMTLHPMTPDPRSSFAALQAAYNDHEFFFVHVKPADARGEDGDFEGKKKVIEEVDELLPMVTGLKPDVLVITGDHSTPSQMAAHSWHPVPVLLSSPLCRTDAVQTFDEIAAASGGLGRMPSVNLMALALAHAGRLAKFGA